MLIGAAVIVFALVISLIINFDRSDSSSVLSISSSDHLLPNQSTLKRRLDTPRSPKRYHVQPDRCILIILTLTLTMLLCILIVSTRQYIKENVAQLDRLFQFCLPHENNYYLNFVPLPIALLILLLLIVNQTRDRRSLHIPIPFNPFSKVNRFDTMILCGLISHEILAMIEDLFLQTTSMRLLTTNGPLFDLIRQIGLIMIMGLRYYPVYAVIDLTDRNVLYYGLCAFYMWLDFGLRVFEQIVCVNNSVLVRAWQKFQELQRETSRWVGSTTAAAYILDDDDIRPGERRGYFRRMKPTTTPALPSLQVSAFSSHSLCSITIFRIGQPSTWISPPLAIRMILNPRSISSESMLRWSMFSNTLRIIYVWPTFVFDWRIYYSSVSINRYSVVIKRRTRGNTSIMNPRSSREASLPWNTITFVICLPEHHATLRTVIRDVRCWVVSIGRWNIFNIPSKSWICIWLPSCWSIIWPSIFYRRVSSWLRNCPASFLCLCWLSTMN